MVVIQLLESLYLGFGSTQCDSVTECIAGGKRSVLGLFFEPFHTHTGPKVDLPKIEARQVLQSTYTYKIQCRSPKDVMMTSKEILDQRTIC